MRPTKRHPGTRTAPAPVLTAGLKAAATRRARIAAGLPPLKSLRPAFVPVDGVPMTAGQKAAATKRARALAAVGAPVPIPEATVTPAAITEPDPPVSTPVEPDAPTVTPAVETPEAEASGVPADRPATLWAPTPEGATRKQPAWTNPRKTSRFKPTTPAGRTDKTDAAFIARLTARIAHTTEDAAADGIETRTQQFTGSACGRGWKIAATDGHRAVLVKGKATAGKKDCSYLLGELRPDAVVLDEAFHLAVKQVRLCAPEKSQAITFTLTGPNAGASARELVVWACDHDGNAARVRLPVWTELAPFELTVNASFVDDLCGRWPLTMRVADSSRAGSEILVFDVAAVRVLVMPMKGASDRATFERIFGARPTPELQKAEVA